MMRAGMVAVVAALLAGACGEAAFPRATAEDLQGRVADIRTAVEDGRVFAARQQLGKLTRVVGRLMEDGVVDDGTAIEILDAAADVQATLELAPTSSSTPTETSTPTESISPSPPPEEEEGEGGNAYGQDKDKGKGHGEEGQGNDD
jgi:hypothetical protein